MRRDFFAQQKILKDAYGFAYSDLTFISGLRSAPLPTANSIYGLNRSGQNDRDLVSPRSDVEKVVQALLVDTGVQLLSVAGKTDRSNSKASEIFRISLTPLSETYYPAYVGGRALAPAEIDEILIRRRKKFAP